MIAVLQRSSNASVSVNDKVIGHIKKGLVIFLGVKKGDTYEDAEHLAHKISTLRIFNDNQNKMNLSLMDISGSALVISQFTICADTKKGRRPSFINAESPDLSKKIYNKFKSYLADKGLKVESGEFGSTMDVKLVNNGPVTFVIDSKE